MFDEALRAHLQSGVALIVGSTTDDGRPLASRAWGVRPGDDARLDVFLDATDADLLAHLREQSPLAVTSADVSTHRSVQLKGTVERVGVATGVDVADAVRQSELLIGRINTLETVTVDTLRRWCAQSFVTCTIRVVEMFDGTPGPHAGAALESFGE